MQLNDAASAVLRAAESIIKKHGRAAIAIDGRSAAGKTSLAAAIAKKTDCTVLHTDDFFIPPERRGENFSKPGGNIDMDRLIKALSCLLNDQKAEYERYLCSEKRFSETVTVLPKSIVLLEGSYSCHPLLWGLFDLHVFLDINAYEQKKRVLSRNGENSGAFFSIWIPREEEYFSAFGIKEKCELLINI